MLPPFIIEQIRRREEEEREDRRIQPVVEMPSHPLKKRRTKPQPDESSDRGVVVIDLM